jgi:hypothetical protein
MDEVEDWCLDDPFLSACLSSAIGMAYFPLGSSSLGGSSFTLKRHLLTHFSSCLQTKDTQAE